MNGAHVEELLIAHTRGELDAGERTRVADHLTGCRDCRAALDEFTRLLATLTQTAPPPPPIHWGAYRAELREKLDRRAGRRGTFRGWMLRPLPAALAAGLVAVLLYVGIPGIGDRSGNGERAAMENAILAGRLDMISRLDLVQQLDLLEDFEVIGGLDRLPARGEG